jgi:DNA-directed RNA polymerase I subunit RPA1
MISCLGRLFTGYLQSIGFTCGIDDMLVKDHAEKNRQKSIQKSEKLGISVAEEFTG